MDSTFQTLETFASLSEAALLIEVLEQHQIEYLIEDRSADPALKDQAGQHIQLQVKTEDVEQVKQLLSEEADKALDSIEKDHYLYSFSDEELLGMFHKPDEWSRKDIALAQKILKERGKEINKEEIVTLRGKRFAQLREPEKADRVWILVGWIGALAGGVVGLIMGYHYWSFKKTDPDGNRFFGYDVQSRKTGYRMFVTGAVLTGLTLLTGLVWYLLDS
jgi:hypothetical protein